MEYLKGMASLSEKNPATRQIITAVAHENFMSIGYEKTSTRMIAEEGGKLNKIYIIILRINKHFM